MFWSSAPKSLLRPGEEDWQIAAWRWLIRELSEARALQDTPLVLPDFEFFPATEATGHDLVEHLFRRVAELMSVDPDAFVIVAHNDHPGRKPGERPSGNYAAGTFSFTDDYRMQVSYHPSLAEEPETLIGVLAHEVAHGIFATFQNPPPGGWEMEEYAVELMTVYFGFGLFGANSAFRTDFTWTTWSTGTLGYISQEQWAFGLAVFLRLRGSDISEAEDWLAPPLKRMLRKSLAYLDANQDILAGIQR